MTKILAGTWVEVEKIILTPEERAAFKTALVPVHDKMASRIGKETIESFYQAVDFKK